MHAHKGLHFDDSKREEHAHGNPDPRKHGLRTRICTHGGLVLMPHSDKPVEVKEKRHASSSGHSPQKNQQAVGGRFGITQS